MMISLETIPWNLLFCLSSSSSSDSTCIGGEETTVLKPNQKVNIIPGMRILFGRKDFSCQTLSDMRKIPCKFLCTLSLSLCLLLLSLSLSLSFSPFLPVTIHLPCIWVSVFFINLFFLSLLSLNLFDPLSRVKTIITPWNRIIQSDGQLWCENQYLHFVSFFLLSINSS